MFVRYERSRAILSCVVNPYPSCTKGGVSTVRNRTLIPRAQSFVQIRCSSLMRNHLHLDHDGANDNDHDIDDDVDDNHDKNGNHHHHLR
eukprot:4028009-Karenia_brevis.AAC.1